MYFEIKLRYSVPGKMLGFVITNKNTVKLIKCVFEIMTKKLLLCYVKHLNSEQTGKPVKNLCRKNKVLKEKHKEYQHLKVHTHSSTAFSAQKVRQFYDIAYYPFFFLVSLPFFFFLASSMINLNPLALYTFYVAPTTCKLRTVELCSVSL